MNKTGYVLIITAIVIIALIMAKADMDTYGEIRPDRKVTESYEGFQVVPDFRYYLGGSEENPDAILGIDPAFLIDERFWIPLKEFSSAEMKDLVSKMLNRYPGILGPEGFQLVSNSGRNIGNLYSFPGRITFIKFEKLNNVVIFPPRMPQAKAPAGSSK